MYQGKVTFKLSVTGNILTLRCKSIAQVCFGWISKHFLRNPFHAISEEQQFQNFGMKTPKMRTKTKTKVLSSVPAFTITITITITTIITIITTFITTIIVISAEMSSSAHPGHCGGFTSSLLIYKTALL